MPQLIPNSDEIVRHIAIEGDPLSIWWTMQVVGRQLGPQRAFGAMIGLLSGLDPQTDAMAARVVLLPEGLEERVLAEQLQPSREQLIAAFRAAVEQRVAGASPNGAAEGPPDDPNSGE